MPPTSMPTSRMERFLTLIGGEENLPPKMRQPSPPPAPPADQYQEHDHFRNLPSVENVLAQDASSEPATTPSHLKSKQAAANPIHPIPIPSDPSAIPQANTTHTPSEADLRFDLRKGEPAPLGINFCPYAAITKFCYKFVTREYQQPLATAFFDAGKIYNREWDLYYIWSCHYQTAKPVIFIPEHQLQTLLNEINTAFPNAEIKITDELRDEGLVMDFDDVRQDLRPKWLGHSTSREQQEYWSSNVPFPSSESVSVSSDRFLEAFKAKMELATEIAKNKSKSKNSAKRQQVVVRRQEMTKQIVRAQRYLGLLPKKDSDVIHEGSTISQTQETLPSTAVSLQDTGPLMPDVGSLTVSTIGVTQAAPHPFDDDVVFIAIDVEAWERPPRYITEVGVATLDTRDLRGQAPGFKGEDWHKLIRARHFRITEYKHLINSQFVEGCPDRFEFGTSEYVAKDSIAGELTKCFHQPFSRKFDDTPNPKSPEIDVDKSQEEKRNIILVGHDVGQDIGYLSQIGFNVYNRSSLIETMDTAAMYRSYSHDPNVRSLGSVLAEFDLVGWNLHNAGNDAVYTIWAMLAICVKQASECGSRNQEESHAEVLGEGTHATVKQTKERAKDDMAGWRAGEDDDGGVALPPTGEDFETKKDEAKKVFGPPRPPAGWTGFYTVGGAPLDV